MWRDVMGRLSGRKLMMELKTLVLLVAEPAPFESMSSGDPNRDEEFKPPLPPIDDIPLWMCLLTLFILWLPGQLPVPETFSNKNVCKLFSLKEI